MNKKILLLNPPGKELYLRDNYCSPVSKAGFYWQPTDLIVQSGILDEAFDVDVIDAIIEEKTDSQVLDDLKQNNYFAILSLTGTASWKEDFSLFEKIKKVSPHTIIAVSGDIALFEHNMLFDRYPCLDIILLNYTTDDLKKYLQGERKALRKLIFRDNSGNINLIDNKIANEFSYPIPLHHKFKNKAYFPPLATRHPSTIILGSQGCPFQCSFCVASRLEYRFRTVDNLIDEIKALAESGIKELFFVDFIFEVNRKRALNICKQIIDENIKMSWFCSSRADKVDKDLLIAMKNAGCHSILFGVESSLQDVIDQQGKGISIETIKSTFQLCNRIGIRPFCNLILGLPGETRESLLNMGQFAREIGSYNAVFSTLVPALGTKLRETMLKDNKITDKITEFSSTGKEFQISVDGMHQDEMESIRKKVMLSYYLHPSVLLNNLLKLKSMYEFKKNIMSWLDILKKTA